MTKQEADCKGENIEGAVRGAGFKTENSDRRIRVGRNESPE